MKSSTLAFVTFFYSCFHVSHAIGLRGLFPSNSNQPIQCGDTKCHPSEICHAIDGCIDPSDCVSNAYVMADVDEINKQCMVAIVDCEMGYTCDDKLGWVEAN